jgi:hypothetical protein
MLRLGLEVDLAGNLQNTSTSRCEAGIRGRDVPKRSAVDDSVWSGRIWMVEGIECFAAQLELHILVDGEVLEEREVRVGCARTVISIPVQIAERANGW